MPTLFPSTPLSRSTLTIAEDTTTLLSVNDFGSYSDVDLDALAAVQITTLETDGALEYDTTGAGAWAAVTLNFFLHAPQGPEPSGTAGYKGFYYHFLDMASGTRFASTTANTSSSVTKDISRSICVNSGWRSARRSSSRKHLTIW